MTGRRVGFGGQGTGATNTMKRILLILGLWLVAILPLHAQQTKSPQIVQLFRDIDRLVPGLGVGDALLVEDVFPIECSHDVAIVGQAGLRKYGCGQHFGAEFLKRGDIPVFAAV